MVIGRMLKRIVKCLLAVTIAAAANAKAHAGESYYVMVFGSQTIPANPNYSHSWATFVRATWEGDGPCPKDATIEAHTISWLPANLIVRVCALCPEEGTNLDLIPTVEYVRSHCERISMWGP